MDELLTSLGLCLISMFLKMKLYSQKDLSILGVFIWITEIYLLVKAEWGWNDKNRGSDQGKGCGAARDIIVSSPTLKQIRGLLPLVFRFHKNWNSIKRDFRLIKDSKHPVSSKVGHEFQQELTRAIHCLWIKDWLVSGTSHNPTNNHQSSLQTGLGFRVESRQILDWA